MPATFTQLNKFFVSTDFSVYYRRTRLLNWQVPATANYSLVCSLSGTLTCKPGENWQLDADQSFILEPNSGIQVTGRQVEFFFFSFAPALVIQHAVSMQLIPANSTVSFKQEPIIGDVKLNTLVLDFLKELTTENPGKEIVMRAVVEQLLVQVLRQYSKPRRSDALELSRVGLIDRRIRKSVELMHAQLDQDLSLRDLAAASYLSTFHFARLFKKLTGSSPHNYLAGVRATRAQLLLAETDLSVNQVAVRVGYLSASHFTKAFRLATGTTPREFRKGLISR
jgi:AraC family transcriptional regulator